MNFTPENVEEERLFMTCIDIYPKKMYGLLIPDARTREMQVEKKPRSKLKHL